MTKKGRQFGFRLSEADFEGLDEVDEVQILLVAVNELGIGGPGRDSRAFLQHDGQRRWRKANRTSVAANQAATVEEMSGGAAGETGTALQRARHESVLLGATTRTAHRSATGGGRVTLTQAA